MADELEAVKIAGEWTKQLALWATGTLVLSLGFLKDFLQGQQVIGAWWWCLVAAWFLLICSVICGHLAFGAPLTGAGKNAKWKLEINNQTRWLSASQMVTFVLGLAAITVFAAFHISARKDLKEKESTESWRSVGCIGPFVSGKSTELEEFPEASDATNCGDIPNLTRLIRRSREEERESLILLVGSADKQPLSDRNKAGFGSNEGLARARAEWVRGEIVKALSLNSDRFLILTVGPRMHGLGLAGSRLGIDRVVQVYILFFRTKREN
jgi:hypothetical protein